MNIRSASSDRQRWEDQINSSFARIRSRERVCWHADVTVRHTIGQGYEIECDYCPARLTLPAGSVFTVPVPHYYTDDL